MRIWFLWKGWSGKSSISAAFASYLAKKWKNTLLIDADINVHTYDLIGIPKNILTPIGENWVEITKYLQWTRTDIKNIPFLASIPPNENSHFLTLDQQNPLLQKISQKNKDNLRFMCIWGYVNEEIGFSCYHAKTDNFILLLSHLMDKKDDYVIIDSVTGIDNVGTMLIHSYDVNILVVEPTEKSLEVYKDFIKSVETLKVKTHIFVIGNKIKNEKDKIFLETNIWKENILGYVEKSKNMKQFDQWDANGFDRFVDENSDNFEAIFQKINGKQRDLDIYSEKIVDNFFFDTTEYYNDYYWISFPDFVNTKNFNFKELYLWIHNK